MNTTGKRRIRHIYHHDGPQPDWKTGSRGWITPEGRFLETKEHWRSIVCQFRNPEIRSVSEASPEDVAEELAVGERIAQLAYSLGWVSLGHAGELNAIGHERVLKSSLNPATLTLQRLLAISPELLIQVELQLGPFNPSLGVHEDFEVREYDLDLFIKRGRFIERREAN